MLGGSESKVRPRESAPEPSLPVDDVGLASVAATLVVSGSASCTLPESEEGGGVASDSGGSGRTPTVGPAFHTLPPVVSRPGLVGLVTESGGQLPPS